MPSTCFSLPTAITSKTKGKICDFVMLFYIVYAMCKNSCLLFKDLSWYIIWVHKLHFFHEFGIHLVIAGHKKW